MPPRGASRDLVTCLNNTERTLTSDGIHSQHQFNDLLLHCKSSEFQLLYLDSLAVQSCYHYWYNKKWDWWQVNNVLTCTPMYTYKSWTSRMDQVTPRNARGDVFPSWWNDINVCTPMSNMAFASNIQACPRPILVQFQFQIKGKWRCLGKVFSYPVMLPLTFWIRNHVERLPSLKSRFFIFYLPRHFHVVYISVHNSFICSSFGLFSLLPRISETSIILVFAAFLRNFLQKTRCHSTMQRDIAGCRWQKTDGNVRSMLEFGQGTWIIHSLITRFLVHSRHTCQKKTLDKAI